MHIPYNDATPIQIARPAHDDRQVMASGLPLLRWIVEVASASKHEGCSLSGRAGRPGRGRWQQLPDRQVAVISIPANIQYRGYLRLSGPGE